MHGVSDYRISAEARANILNIYLTGDDTFGNYQAEAYAAGLLNTFTVIADFPKAGASAAELMPRLRRFRFQSHVIYFTDEGAIATDRQSALWRNPDEDKKFIELQCLKFRLDSTHVARPTLFLASDDSDGITGHNLIVDAGLAQVSVVG